VRLARMDRAELKWRARQAARTHWDRTLTRLRPPAWKRRDLQGCLSPLLELDRVHDALSAGQALEAHRAIARVLEQSPQRFAIAPGSRADLVARIRRTFPRSAASATLLAGRVLGGEYDLLGYRGLRFGATPDAIDWHFDPVHATRAPRTFWAAVPFLDTTCGDHKIVWELNRHQHWLRLGRAYWLTGDRRYRERALHELSSWLCVNPPLIGINWASMLELGLRSLSWVWAINFFAESSADDREPWLVDLLLALDRQLTQIERNRSHYFSPNTHLLGEALALYVCGRTLPLLARSERWASIGRRILADEVTRQIEPDGFHAERSTHYHRYTLDFYLLALTVARLTGDEAASEFEDAANRLATAARLVADDRGRLPHIGDDDGGSTWPLTGRPVDDISDSLASAAVLLERPELSVAAAPEETFWLAGHPMFQDAFDIAGRTDGAEPPASGALRQTGYYVSRAAGKGHLVIDAGPHGYQNGGHAHADALSVTLSVRDVPFLIDTGTGTYTADRNVRDRFRSTAAHNTVVVDGRPQSIARGPFHWSHMAHGAERRWIANGAFDYFEGAHGGYTPLEHRRHLFVSHGDLMIVADLVHGDAGVHQAGAFWHLDPQWQVTVSGPHAICTARGDRVDLFVPEGALQHFRGDEVANLGWCAPVYGPIVETSTLRVARAGSAPLWITAVFGLTRDNPITRVDLVPVWAEGGAPEHSLGIRIERAHSTDLFAVVDRANGRATRWRVGETESNARALMQRVDGQGRVTRVAVIDGSFVRATGGRRLMLTLNGECDTHLDLVHSAATGGHRDGAAIEARLNGTTAGVVLQVAGHDVPVAADRRSRARLSVGAV
jgi:hypothetical protein